MTEDKARKGKRSKAAEEQANVEVVEVEPEAAAEVKPKRHRRTKAEIEAADAAGEPRRIRKPKAKVEAEVEGPGLSPLGYGQRRGEPQGHQGQIRGGQMEARVQTDKIASDLESEISGVYLACDVTNKRWEVDLLSAIKSLLAVCPLSAAGLAAARRRLGKEPLVWLKHINQRAIDSNSR